MLPDYCGAKHHWEPWRDPRVPHPHPLKPAVSQVEPVQCHLEQMDSILPCSEK